AHAVAVAKMKSTTAIVIRCCQCFISQVHLNAIISRRPCAEQMQKKPGSKCCLAPLTDSRKYDQYRSRTGRSACSPHSYLDRSQIGEVREVCQGAHRHRSCCSCRSS